MRGENQPRLFSLVLVFYHNHFSHVVLFEYFLRLSRIFQFYKIMTMSENSHGKGHWTHVSSCSPRFKIQDSRFFILHYLYHYIKHENRKE